MLNTIKHLPGGKVRLILFIGLVTSFSQLSAQEVFTVFRDKEPVKIGNKFLYLNDATRKITLNDALNNIGWIHVQDEIPNFDITKNAVWGKIKLTCAQEGDWYLGIIPSCFNRIDFYQKRGNGPWITTSQGNTIPILDKQVPVNEIFIRLDILPGDTTQLLFRLQDYYPMQLNISVGEASSFLAFFQNLNLYNGLCYGVMLMMLLYNLYLFFIQKETIYIYYVLYILGNGIFTMVFNGNFMYLPGFIKVLVLFDPFIFPASFGIFLALFTIELFKGFLPERFIKLLYVFILVAISDILIGLFDKYIAFDFIRILGLILGMVSLMAGIVALRRKSPSAKFYIIGFGAYMGSLIFIILSGPVLPITSFTIKALVTGGAVESVFLSFAQGDKLKFLQVEREKARNETLLQLQENDRLVREQNQILEQKVQERTAELAEKNKEVTDSIQYARRIQKTLLADNELLNRYLPEHFIIYKPKDIVSGDFYWAACKESTEGEQGKGMFYLAVCDSTGHGVPGAFMSLLNISFLNEAIVEKQLATPSEAFDYVRSHLINSISRDGGRDGMDGILLAIKPDKDKNSYTCTYAASNNKPVLIHGNELSELNADKMPVGQWENMSPFTLNMITAVRGDMLYLFTDGFADQFGGPGGKKYKHKQLMEKLKSVSAFPIEDQKYEIEKTFELWKGNLEQVDDVLMIGIRFV